MKNKYVTLLKDTLIFALGSIGTRLVLFIMVPLYTNYLTEAEYGISELVFTTAQLVIPVVSLVIFDAVSRFALSKQEKPSDVLLNGILVWAAGTVVTVCITPLLGLYPGIGQWQWYLCVYISFNILHSVVFCYLKVTGRNRLYSVLSVAQTLLMACLNVVLLVGFHIGIRGYLLANTISLVVGTLMAILAGKLPRELMTASFDKNLLKRMIIYSAPMILNNLSWWAIQSSNKLMVEILLGASALGLYAVATKIPALINVIVSIFSQAWGISAVTELEGENDRKFYAEVFDGFSFLCFAACIFLTAIMKPFMGVYVADNFFSAWQYIPLLLVAAAFSAVSSYFGSMFGALKDTLANMWTTLAAAVVNVGVNLILIPRIGLWGAVVGTVAAYIVIANMRMAFVLRKLPIPIDFKKYIGGCVLITLQAAFVGLELWGVAVSVLSACLFLLLYRKSLLVVIRKAKNLRRK